MNIRHILLEKIPHTGTDNRALIGPLRDADEKTISKWVAGGMVGKLVRQSPTSPVTVEPCPEKDNGTWGIEVRS